MFSCLEIWDRWDEGEQVKASLGKGVHAEKKDDFDISCNETVFWEQKNYGLGWENYQEVKRIESLKSRIKTMEL